MKNILLAVAVAILTLLSGCSSTSTSQEIALKQMELEEKRMEFEARKMEIAQDQREAEIDSVPEWVLNPPQSDSTGFYAVGISESNKISFSMKKAKIQAEFELAKQYKQLLSGSERSYESEGNDGNISSQTEILIDKIIEEVPIVGYDVVKQEVKAQQGKHVAYIMLKMPYAQYNKVLMEQKKDATSRDAKQAFADLEKRLEKRQSKAEVQSTES
jgi:outer membrane murein-binding lipoprotein Lpp